MTGQRPVSSQDDHSELNQGGCWPTPVQENLLRACLWEGEAARGAWEKWHSSVDIERLDYGSTRLLPLLAHNLKEQGIDDPWMPRYLSVSRSAWYQSQLVVARAAELLQSFEELGIPTLVFKGAALAPLYYPSVTLRPMTDFDILVPSSQFVTAVRWVLGHGWRPSPQWRAAEPMLGFFLEHTHGHGFINQQGQSVDIHGHLLAKCCGADDDAIFWNDAVATEIVGAPTRTLCATDHFFQTLVHGVHWNTVAPLRWVADAFMIHRAQPLDWDRLVEQTRFRNLALPIYPALKYLREAFDFPVPEEVLRELQSLPVPRLERLEYNAITIDPQQQTPWQKAFMRCRKYTRWEDSRGIRGKTVGFLHYVQAEWGLLSPWLVPVEGARRVLRQIRTRASATANSSSGDKIL